MSKSLQTLQDWLLWQESLHSETMDFDLKRIKSVYAKLSIPKLAKKTIIVAGSNGKGSCVAMLQSIYVNAGYKIGVYTSPHLLNYNERIKINNQPVSDEQLIAAFKSIEKVRNKITLTYYEYGTLAAFICFAESNLDVAVLEVGLGGRLDATNIIDCDAAIIASISLDHQQWLGDTVEEIAYEKAGVLRSHQQAFCGDYAPQQTLLQYADNIGVKLNVIGQDFDIRHEEISWHIVDNQANGQAFGPLVTPKLNGEHQYKNAACVVQLCRAWHEFFPIELSAINKGLASTELTGRCEVISHAPHIIIDVAHNEGAVIELQRYLQSLAKVTNCYIIVGLLDDKPAEIFFKYLEQYASCWFFTQVQAVRSLPASQLKSRYLAYHKENNTKALPCSYHNSVKNALKAVSKKVEKQDRILIIGSFYTVAEALHHAS